MRKRRPRRSQSILRWLDRCGRRPTPVCYREAATSPHLLPESRSGAGGQTRPQAAVGDASASSSTELGEQQAAILAYASGMGRFSLRRGSMMAQGPLGPCCGATQRRHQPFCGDGLID